MGTEFTRNYSDHSNDTGFQFEFHCDKCGNGWRSSFQGSGLGLAASFLRAASSLFGGLNAAASAGDHVKDALRGKAWDDAFAAAVGEGRKRFKQCTKCGTWVCPDVCWNAARGLCEACAPDLEEHAAAIQAQVAVEQMWEKARASDQTEGADMRQKKKVGQCPHCNARAGNAKFCPECGKPMAPPSSDCAKCGAKLAAKAKFCGECGTPRAVG